MSKKHTKTLRHVSSELNPNYVYISIFKENKLENKLISLRILMIRETHCLKKQVFKSYFIVVHWSSGGLRRTETLVKDSN